MSAAALATVPPQYVIVFGKYKILPLHIIVKIWHQFIAFREGFARQKIHFFVHRSKARHAKAIKISLLQKRFGGRRKAHRRALTMVWIADLALKLGCAKCAHFYFMFHL